MEGFEEPDGRVPEPLVKVGEETREMMKRVIAAITLGATPEEIADGLERGFEPKVEKLLAQPLEAKEASDHVDVLLSILQAPSPFVAV